jgi:Holliday junction resolvasome RuvABC DNA-binding subunit
LVALGIKKREANKKTNDVFQRQVPKDISSFLKEALK